MTAVTWVGLKRAARNVALFPFRLFAVALKVAFTVLVTVLLAVVVTLALVGWYFYAVKADQPMQIDPRFADSLPPEGMTFRELWQDRFAGWQKIDERRYQAGESESKSVCVSTEKTLFPVHVFISALRIYEVRFRPDSPAARDAVAGVKGMIAPAELSLLDAVWWQIENEVWWFWVDHETRTCTLPPPKRPQTATGSP